MKIITINDFEYPVYATVDDADKYFSAKFASTWDEIVQIEKEKLLVTATREIDKLHFQGIKENINQELEFPRIICGYCFNPVNPEKELMICCCEIANAIYNLQTDSNVATPNADKIKTMTVGDTSITYQDGVNIDTDIFSATATPFIKKYLGRFLKGNIRIIL